MRRRTHFTTASGDGRDPTSDPWEPVPLLERIPVPSRHNVILVFSLVTLVVLALAMVYVLAWRDAMACDLPAVIECQPSR